MSYNKIKKTMGQPQLKEKTNKPKGLEGRPRVGMQLCGSNDEDPKDPI